MEQNSKTQSGLDSVKDKGGLSKIDRMTPYQIIEKDIEKFGLGVDPKKAYAAIRKMVEQPNFRVLRANDSFMLIDNHGDGTGDAMMFTADKPQTFVKSLKHFDKALRAGGFHQMTFTSSGIAIEPLMKKAGLKFKAVPIKIQSGDKVLDGQHITVFE
jgi:hypothetical protein